VQRELLHQVTGVQALHVARDGFGALGHGTVDPDADGGGAAALQVGSEIGWDLDGQAQLAAAHASVEVGFALQGGFFQKVGRAREVEHVVAADGGLVAVEHGKAQVLHVHADAVAHDDHQQGRAHQGQGEADAVALQLQRFAVGVAEQARQAEARRAAVGGGGGGLGGFDRWGEGPAGCGGALLCALGLFQQFDEGVFQLVVAVALHQLGWGAAVEHAPCVHQRDAVAALGLVHEVGGDEQGHAILTRELDHQLPELVAGDGVHAGGGLVEDEHVRPVHHGHGQRQALAHAQRQLVGQLVGHVGQLEAGHHLGDARVALRSGHFEDARVQVEVLAHGEFAVERKGLRHVAHAAAHGQVMGVRPTGRTARHGPRWAAAGR
jgi:hypothetical protein